MKYTVTIEIKDATIGSKKIGGEHMVEFLDDALYDAGLMSGVTVSLVSMEDDDK
ncbi:MAG TPA: hypothetical protein VGN15_12260 [Ktedonobacteraceae bacterium]|nr:hypothetical protein [Ktedonobacteraceae bacterium]